MGVLKSHFTLTSARIDGGCHCLAWSRSSRILALYSKNNCLLLFNKFGELQDKLYYDNQTEECACKDKAMKKSFSFGIFS